MTTRRCRHVWSITSKGKDVNLSARSDDRDWWVSLTFRRAEFGLALIGLNIAPAPDADPRALAAGVSPFQLSKSLRLGHLIAEARREIAEVAQFPLVPKALSDQVRQALLSHPGRGGRADVNYAIVAAAYVREAARTSWPVDAVARAYDLEPPKVRDLIHRARVRGLLTKGAVGRGGGELTDKARALLAEYVKSNPKPGTKAKR